MHNDLLKKKRKQGLYESELKKEASYDRLLNFELARNDIKKSIMTFQYNAANVSMVDYVLKELDVSEQVSKDDKKIIVYTKQGKNTVLYKQDVSAFIDLYKHFFAEKAPRIAKLRDYLNTIGKIYGVINKAVPWKLPSGVSIVTGYWADKELKISPYPGKRIQLTYKIPADHLDVSKMRRALMPTFV